MLGRILEIYDEGRHLSLNRGFIDVRGGGEVLGSVPLDDIGGLLLSAQSVTVTKHILNALSQRGSITVLCGRNYVPQSMVCPVANHYLFAKVVRAQIAASVPFNKRIWKRIVTQKIRNQALVLDLRGQKDNAGLLHKISAAVRSGDTDNKEGYAAKLYWKFLFGPGFVRDRHAGGVNSLLNYGYAVLRASMARAVCSSGLLPALGIHHKNNLNQFCLVDDLFEVYRPLADYRASTLLDANKTEVTPETKKALADILWTRVSTPSGFSPVFQSMQYMANSYAKALDCGEPHIEIPSWVVAEDGELDA